MLLEFKLFFEVLRMTYSYVRYGLFVPSYPPKQIYTRMVIVETTTDSDAFP